MTGGTTFGKGLDDSHAASHGISAEEALTSNLPVGAFRVEKSLGKGAAMCPVTLMNQKVPIE